MTYKLSVTYAAGHTQEYAPSGNALSGADLHTAAGAFLNDLVRLEGTGITRLVAEVEPAPPSAASVAAAFAEAKANEQASAELDRAAALRTLATMAESDIGKLNVPVVVVTALAKVNYPEERDAVLAAIAVLVGGEWQEVA